MNKDQKFCLIAGIAIAAVSTAAAVDITFRKKHHTLGLLAGLAGTTAGILIATHPARSAMKKLALDDLFEDENPEEMDEHIAEMLSDAACDEIVEAAPIELDEEATAADFE